VQLFFVTSELMDKEVLEAHRKILEAIRLRQNEEARAAMLHLLDIAAEDLHGELRS